MKITMKTLAAGPAGVLLEGGTYDLPDEQAQSLIAGGYAQAALDVGKTVEDVESQGEMIETADVPVEPVEVAVKPRPRKKK